MKEKGKCQKLESVVVEGYDADVEVVGECGVASEKYGTVPR
jgi:hypothetical protein